MKKIYIILSVLLFQMGYSQNKLTENEKLVSTAKIWGFLKYYHPIVASGKVDWDKQLFEILPLIEKTQNKEAFSSIIENWITSLGEVPKCLTCNESIVNENKYFYKNIDLTWLNKSKLFSKKLSNQLKYIQDNRYQGNQFYIGQREAGDIFTKNENYSEYKFQDKNFRILSLFRYWNIIEYFYPDKYLMSIKWDKTLNDLLPLFTTAQTQDDFQIAMLRLVTRLNDSHTTFYFVSSENRKKTRRFLPVNCKIIDNKMIITEILNDSLAKNDDLKIGDIITKINGKTIPEIIKNKREYIPASNEAFYYKNLALQITTGFNDFIDIETMSKEKSTPKKIYWQDYAVSHKKLLLKKKEKYTVLPNNIGYVDMGKLLVRDVDAMMAKLGETKAIILDIRNYPNETNFQISKYLNSKVKPFVKYTIADLKYPGRYIWTETRICGSENPNYYKGKVIILINENSISQSEWATMCFQTADNVTVIGSQTAGADGNVSHIDFVKDYDAPFSGIGVYYPDGRETQRVGIIPDIKVQPTIVGIQQGKDEVLERAIKYIETGK